MKPAWSAAFPQPDETESRAMCVVRNLPESGAQDAPSWEMVAPGRYMPRRTRGSFRGRELG